MVAFGSVELMCIERYLEFLEFIFAAAEAYPELKFSVIVNKPHQSEAFYSLLEAVYSHKPQNV